MLQSKTIENITQVVAIAKSIMNNLSKKNMNMHVPCMKLTLLTVHKQEAEVT